MSRATSLRALVGNLRFLVVWKTWAALVVFGAGIAVGVVICFAASDDIDRRTLSSSRPAAAMPDQMAPLDEPPELRLQRVATGAGQSGTINRN